MTTREGRRDRRIGAIVPDERKQAAANEVIKLVMSRLYDAIQGNLINLRHGEIKVVVTTFDGGISRCIVGSDEILKPE